MKYTEWDRRGEHSCCLQIFAGLLQDKKDNLGLLGPKGLNQHQWVESIERHNQVQYKENLLKLQLTKDGQCCLERW